MYSIVGLAILGLIYAGIHVLAMIAKDIDINVNESDRVLILGSFILDLGSGVILFAIGIIENSGMLLAGIGMILLSVIPLYSMARREGIIYTYIKFLRGRG